MFCTALSTIVLMLSAQTLRNLQRFDDFTFHVSYLIFYDTSLYILYTCMHICSTCNILNGVLNMFTHSHTIQEECRGASSEYEGADAIVDDDYDPRSAGEAIHIPIRSQKLPVPTNITIYIRIHRIRKVIGQNPQLRYNFDDIQCTK